MGRGLSELQRQILGLTLRHERTGRGDTLHYSHLLAFAFGFEVARPWAPWKDRETLGEWRVLEGVRRYVPHCGKLFDPEKIGPSRYAAAVSSLSRAAVRLESRGLVRIMQGAWAKWSGVALTEAGRAVAEGLPVETTARLPTYQPIDVEPSCPRCQREGGPHDMDHCRLTPTGARPLPPVTVEAAP